MLPQKELIYLSPNATQELQDWEEDEILILIIGRIVDLAQSKLLTGAVAKRDGFRSAKPPLDQYVTWGANKKLLPLHQIIRMLSDFQSVKLAPRYCCQCSLEEHKSPEEIEEEERLGAEKMKFKKKKFFIVDSFFDSSDQGSLHDTFQDMEDVYMKSDLGRQCDRNFWNRNNEKNRNSMEKGGRCEGRRILLNRMISLKSSENSIE